MSKYNPFNRIQVETPGSNMFDLSFDNKLTLDMASLYPVMSQETLPGDYFTITPEMLIRFAPMTFPIMHRIDATIHFFYVPNRIMWANWTKFLAGENYAHPYYSWDGSTDWEIKVKSLWDYLGLPVTANMKEKINAFPHLAFWRIYNEYYQDQNNDSNFTILRDYLESTTLLNGQIDMSTFPINMDDPPARAWQHDYFTSALPYAQKGDPVNIPLTLESIELSKVLNMDDSTAFPGALSIGLNAGETVLEDSNNEQVKLVGDDLSAELTGTINQLRIAMQLQKFLEKNARSGTRYNELILAHFGEKVADYRINRPEYLGGIKNNIVISEVLQTSATDGTSALGDYGGHGTGVVSGNTIKFRSPEHGWIIGILSVLPVTAYFQGINRKLSRNGYLDYFWFEFAHIGEQAIESKELYYSATDTHEQNIATFGYIPRYSEYKYNPSEVHGNFRTDMLDFHLARNFATRPELNEEFVYCSNDDRIFAVTEEGVQSLYAHVYFNMMAKRKIPFFSNPGGI